MTSGSNKLWIWQMLGLVVLVISAYLSVTLPISEKGIPFTAQSLAVFVIAGLYVPRHYAAIVIVYLILGAIGLPVFAEGSSGWSKLAGASGGFLYGFLFSGLLISVLSAGNRSSPLGRVIAIMVLGTVVLFVFGLGHLALKFGWEKAMEYGFYPFWKMALVKAFLASLLVFFINRGLETKIKS